MFLWLRRIASCFFFTQAILFAALWVRSYFYFDTVAKREAATNPGPYIRTLSGTVTYIRKASLEEALPAQWRWVTGRVELYPLNGPIPESSFFGFQWKQRSFKVGLFYTDLQTPLWFPTLVTALLALAIRPAPRFKFNLRDLFTLTTVAALTIGPLAFWLRSIS